jgi:uncharacterized protein YegL
MNLRRLPVYVLLDCSESMIGTGLDGLRAGLDSMLKALRQNPHALETAWLSFITFDRTAEVKCPLTPVEDLQIPDLRIRSGTALGAALRLLAQRIQEEVKRPTPQAKGDFRPLVILITDGQPTDDWRPGLHMLNSVAKVSNIYAVGCGDDIDFSGLKEITDIVLNLQETDASSFAKLFVWITDTVSTASMGVGDDREAMLAKLPDSIQKVDQPKFSSSGPNRQLFLFARCGREGQPYLMRYRLDPIYQIYSPVASHRITPDVSAETDSRGGGGSNDSIDSSMIDGCPPCPWCRNDGAGSCGNCRTVFCGSARKPDGTSCCPGCHETLRGSSGGGFRISTSDG